MTIKQLGGVFGRNPTFNNVTIDGELIINGDTFTGLDYQGAWNASTNTPTLVSSTGTLGEFYIVSVAGTTNLNGVTNWGVGDWALFNGSVWQRVEGGADGNFANLTVTGTGKIDDLIVGATSAPQAGVNLEVKSATSELRLSTSDGSITNGETIGKITWNAPDEGSGPNAIIVAGEISLVSDGNWDSTRYTPSNIVFKTTPVNGPTMVEAARFTSTGNLAFPSGQGIDFSATAGTGTSELLDDYEEGTWTPVLIGTTVAGTGTYTTQEGKYTKVGNLVTFQMGLNWSAHTGTGTMQIQGLPFTTSATGLGVATVYVSDVASSAGTFIECFVSNSTTDIRLREVATGGGTAAAVAMDTAGQMFISGHYYV
jgi:hypothetical protein